MNSDIETARQAALEVLLHNTETGAGGLPRTAAFGYPEPYTRDLMVASLGISVSKNPVLINSLGKVLMSLAKSQTLHGHIPGLADQPDDRGASDTTPWFLIGLSIYRQLVDDSLFLENAAARARGWMEHQSPGDRVIVAQQPTSDWRDEQWVLGYGLYVNTLVYTYLKLCSQNERASALKREMLRPVVTSQATEQGQQEGLLLPTKPHLALWSYKVHFSDRFDLLGNSLAILSGLASRQQANRMVDWVEMQCQDMREARILSVDLPPNLFPFIEPTDMDWHDRYAIFNQPGTYHNGGIWPFICGFYIASLVALGRTELATEKLECLTALVKNAADLGPAFGFNEWHRPHGEPAGVDWQSWSAAMYLYATYCVEHSRTPIFESIRSKEW